MDSVAMEKEVFMKEFGEDYGYPHGPKSIDDIRSSEFKRLEGSVYLDHAGATLYSELQMEMIYKDLSANIYGNPHSQFDSGSATLNMVRDARQQILDYCNASPEDYKCVFTSGATAALKLVGESFPWTCQSCFMYTMENHNSVIGIREFALEQGASAFALDVEESNSPSKSPVFEISSHPIQRRSQTRTFKQDNDKFYSLFAFPSECNFSGVRFSLDLVKTMKESPASLLDGTPHSGGTWMVLVDAAKGSSTEPPDLSNNPADFVIISFYKLFGYPTGLGALIVRNESAKLLRRNYFSGGTVAASIADIDFVRRREEVEGLFEDGTISFLSIAALRPGFKILNNLTKSAIYRHITSLSKYAKKRILELCHSNGSAVCTVYGRHTSTGNCNDVSSIITFNLKRADGSWHGYREVEKLASLFGIQLRTGCFCNPGACAKYLGLSHSDLIANIEAGHVCWDDYDILHEKPTGAVRISFGYMSNFEDVNKFIHFINNAFVSLPSNSGFLQSSLASQLPSPGVYLKSIAVYPIKSCGGFSEAKWPLSSSGLLYDREWILKSLTGDLLTQKRVPEMCLIRTYIDLSQGLLLVESPRCDVKLQIDLNPDSSYAGVEEIDLRDQRYIVGRYSNEVNSWFTTATAQHCVLLRHLSSQNQCSNKYQSNSCRRRGETKLKFPNEAQFLLISEESVDDLNNRVYSRRRRGGCEEEAMWISGMRFRPNLVVAGGGAYVEDEWKRVEIGSNKFSSVGGCNRCEMINFSHDGCEVHRLKEPLATLASYRRAKGKILFGILLKYDEDDDDDDGDEVVRVEEGGDSWLCVGQEVRLIN